MSRLDDELAALAEMAPAQLHERWLALEGCAAPALAAPLLRRLLAQRLQERRHCGLPAAVRGELTRIAEGEPTKLVGLSCLAPDIFTAIIEGKQPEALTARRLGSAMLPLGWAEQRQMLGFTGAL